MRAEAVTVCPSIDRCDVECVELMFLAASTPLLPCSIATGSTGSIVPKTALTTGFSPALKPLGSQEA